MLFVKFVLVGILNSIFGYFVWAFMVHLGLHYALSVVLASIINILFNFKTTGMLVFKNKNNALIFRFVAIYLIIIALNIMGLKIAKTIGFDIYLAGFVLTIILGVVSFLLQKQYVFVRKK